MLFQAKIEIFMKHFYGKSLRKNIRKVCTLETKQKNKFPCIFRLPHLPNIIARYNSAINIHSTMLD